MTCSFLFITIHLLALLGSILGEAKTTVTSTLPPTQTSAANDVKTTFVPTTAGVMPIKDLTKAPSSGNEGADYQLRQDLELLLDELRQVATAIHEVRTEHGQLAKNVAEMSVVVKDMSERNMHIRKKVRKMSKVLNKSTHHHKVKDGIRALQRDHQKILHAMSSRNITLLNLEHSLNRTGHHHHHPHRNNNNDNNLNNNLTSFEDDLAQIDEEIMEEDDNKEKSTSNAGSSSISKKQDGNGLSSVTENKDVKVIDTSEESEDANLIPELVVEPPEGQAVTGPSYPRDCREVMNYGNYTSGSYMIQPEGLHKPIKVCYSNFS